MNDSYEQNVKEYILAKIQGKPFYTIKDQLPSLIEDFLTYDFHFMRLTKVLDENDEHSDNEYDEDDAFEYIYEAYLSDHAGQEDEEMLIAKLLNRYMELHAEFLDQQE